MTPNELAKLIPDEVVEAADAEYERCADESVPPPIAKRRIFAAMLAAWPGAYKSDPALFGHKLILPFPQKENSNE